MDNLGGSAKIALRSIPFKPRPRHRLLTSTEPDHSLHLASKPCGMHGAVSTSAGPLKGNLASLSRPQGQTSSTLFRPSVVRRKRCSLPGAVGPGAPPAGSHEAHNALVEKNR